MRGCSIKTGLFTSPHIFSELERIKVNGKNIPKKDFDRLVNKIKKPAKKFKITFFETITAIAFLYFLEQDIDYTILEVGLGGRLDATNVTEPKVSVITRIGYDHVDILGKTLEKIAKEKAGIIHPGSFVVISPQRPSALKVIKDKIQSNHNRYCDVGRELKVTDIKSNLSGVRFAVKDKNWVIGKYKIGLIGKHQVENVCTALAVLRHLQEEDKRITEKGIKKGLAEAKILTRCQVISKRPLIIIDSAHNPESAQSLFDVIRTIIKKKVIIVFGSSRGKLIKDMFRILLPVTRQFILTQSQNPRHIPSSELALTLKSIVHGLWSPVHSPRFSLTNNVSDAVKQGLFLQKEQKIPLIITGSFYIASEALVSLKQRTLVY